METNRKSKSEDECKVGWIDRSYNKSFPRQIIKNCNIKISPKTYQLDSAVIVDMLSCPACIIDDNIVVSSNEAAIKSLELNPLGISWIGMLSKIRKRICNYDRLVDFCRKRDIIGSNNNFTVEYVDKRLFSLNVFPFRNDLRIATFLITWIEINCDTFKDELIDKNCEMYWIIGESVPFGIWRCDKDGNLQYCSNSFLNLLQMSMEEAKCFGWTNKVFPEDVNSMLIRWLQCIKTGEPWECEFRISDKESVVRTVLSRGRPVRQKNGEISYWLGINLDITERKKMEDELKKIEWLLTKTYTPSKFNWKHQTNLNDSKTSPNGEIARSCEIDLLENVVNEYLDLLETCTSIYELDGSCTLKIYRSSWCKYLNSNCLALDDRTAVKSISLEDHKPQSKCCNRKKISMMAIKSGVPVDKECNGGFRLYAVPVRAGKEVIGAINFGYGDPLMESDAIKSIARHFDVNPQILINIAKSYESRPQFIIDIAKSRLISSARMIGTIVERKRAEVALQKAYDEVERMVEARTEALSKSHNLIKEQTKERIRAETESSRMYQALQLVYTMATAISVTIDNVVDEVVTSIAKLIDIPFVAFGSVERGEFKGVTQINNGVLNHYTSLPIKSHPCGIFYNDQSYRFITGDLQEQFPLQMEAVPGAQSIFGIPVRSSKGKIMGLICILDTKKRKFSEYEKQLVEIFARYTGHEIERKQMERQLLQAQEMKVLGQLTSGVAHEVRNPLNGILAITEALHKDFGQNPDYKCYIDHIRKQVTRLSDLMKDLLNLGRPIEKSEFVPISVSKLISSAINLWRLSSDFRDRPVNLKINENKNPSQILANKARMEQVIINLLENSCAHSNPEQSVTIEVLDNDKNLLLRIIDQGTGIKKEHLEHLFEPFFTTRRGGTGLGLGIVKRIIESHEGSIEISNNCPPPGVTAEINIPLIESIENSALNQENANSKL